MSSHSHEDTSERSMSATAPSSKVEGDKAEKEEKPRVNELELRAKSMEAVEVSVADRMAILEGMLAARKNGDNIKYDAGILLDAVARAYK
ncbi:hypothetical protein B9Z19DRAFT_1122553 [Tuber borchii]|uniref:Uncharacterized protein n=1 Tax=Tuber borchii TaxID=42251 RepID=A0A2T7A0A3_TUBBO|nr:hypothetical protein B9Z19DRAFT_1122553 [Tuber borchii]